jgi:hypothetical protein
MESALGYKEIIEKDLADMPPELIQEVIDFIQFLKEKRVSKTGPDHNYLLMQQDSLERIWAKESEELYEL